MKEQGNNSHNSELLRSAVAREIEDQDIKQLQKEGRLGDYRLPTGKMLRDATRRELMESAAQLEKEGRSIIDQSDAKAYRVAQAQKLLDLFEGAKGRPAKTVEELTEWAGSPEGRKAQAYVTPTSKGKIIP